MYPALRGRRRPLPVRKAQSAPTSDGAFDDVAKQETAILLHQGREGRTLAPPTRPRPPNGGLRWTCGRTWRHQNVALATAASPPSRAREEVRQRPRSATKGRCALSSQASRSGRPAVVETDPVLGPVWRSARPLCPFRSTTLPAASAFLLTTSASSSASISHLHWAAYVSPWQPLDGIV